MPNNQNEPIESSLPAESHSRFGIEHTPGHREVLKSLIEGLAHIIDKGELLQLINTQFRKVLSFNHSIIGFYREEENAFINLVVDPDSPSRRDPVFWERLQQPFPADDGIYNVLLQAPFPVVFDLAALYAQPNPPAYVKANFGNGMKKMIGVSLGNEKKKLGVLGFFIKEEGQIPQPALEFIHEASHQISMAIVYVLAHEELRTRETEKSMLLSLSNEIAAVRSREDLSEVVGSRIRSLIGSQGIVVDLISPGGRSHSAYLIDSYELSQDHPDIMAMQSRTFPLEDGIFNLVVHSGEPVNLDIAGLVEEGNAPDYVRVWHTLGRKQLTVTALRAGKNVIGALWVLAGHPVNKGLLTGIGSQIAIAVLNILANDEIREREEEKALLLAFTNELTAVKDRNDLAITINKYLNDLFLVKEYMLSVKNPGSHTHSFLLHDTTAPFTRAPGFERVLHAKMNIHGGPAEIVFDSDDPVIFDMEEAIKSTTYSFPSAVFWRSVGIPRLMAVKLKAGDENIGIIWLEPRQVNFRLMEGIAAQLAIALSNIMASESARKRELEKSNLLSFSNELASVRDRAGLAGVVSKYMKDLFLIKEYMITTNNPDGETYSFFVFDETVDLAAGEAFGHIKNNKIPIRGGFAERVYQSDGPVNFDMEYLLKSDEVSFPNASFWQSAGISEIVGIALRVGKENLGIFWTQSQQLNDEHILMGVSAQIAIAIANIIANDKISQQVREINSYRQRLENENQYLQQEIVRVYNYTEIVGGGQEMQKVYHLLSQVAFAQSTVLLLGETGTGKELVARAIHNASPRKDKLMAKVNCAALPPNLIESELFGHERGSFTGALERRVGKFELANNGTLFLDEIGEMPVELQVKLLRVIQEREIERVGGRTTIKTDVRLIAATNRNLLEEVEAGRFRSDLFYRLNVFPIKLPPLRERTEDIPALVSHFIAKHSRKIGKEISGCSAKVIGALKQYPWPGNIRELEHLIERSILLANGPVIHEVDLPDIRRSQSILLSEERQMPSIDDVEKAHILAVLRKTRGKVSGPGGAAELLNLPPSTLSSKMRRLNIQKEFKNP